MTPARGSEEARARRRYRVLLRLMPPGFRRTRARELEDLFAQMWALRREATGRVGAAFWLSAFWDLLTQAPAAWMGEARARWGRAAGRPRVARQSRSIRAAHHDPDGEGPMRALAHDFRLAFRTLARQPLHGSLIVVLMGLAVGANAAVFRIYDGLFLRPLPFQASERLVDLDTRAPRWNLEYTSLAYADFVLWREGNRTFEAMGVWDDGGANLQTPDGAERVSLAFTSHDLAGVLGLEPAAGRLFTADEDVPDGPKVALLTHGFWERAYGGDPGVVGSTAVLDDVAWEIVGVLPPEAEFVQEADLWLPLQENADAHDSFYLQGVGRLRPGVSLAAAEEDLTAIHKSHIDRFPVNRGTFPVVSSLKGRYLGDVRGGLRVLFAAVGVVLLLACANIAGLMLVRAMGRSRETAVRLAMGAGRARLVRQLLAESLVLAALGGAVGAALGTWTSGWVAERVATQFPSWVRFETDGRLLLFTLVIVGATAVLFGLVPALRTARANPLDSFQATTGRGTARARRLRATNALVGAEVALASVLLVVAGLVIRDVGAVTNVNPGFRTEGVLSYVVQLPGERYPSADARLAFWSDHLERVRALPEVRAAGATTILPLGGHTGYFFEADGAPPRGEDEGNPVVLVRAVSPGYLEAMDIEVLAGRSIEEGDGRDAGSSVVVVNETFVRTFLGHLGNPVGARVRTGGADDWWTVVGVTRDTRHYGLAEEVRPGVFVPLPQLPDGSMTMAVHTGVEPTALVDPLQDLLAAQDPTLPMFRVGTMAEALEESLWSRRAMSWLATVFAAASLMLAVAGIYGVISYGVRQRSQEIGIRMAMGARRQQVARSVLGQAMSVVGAGVALGLGLAVAGAPLMRTVLSTADPWDPWVHGWVGGMVLVTSALAAFLPARRAAAVDPMGVLRGE